MKRHQQDSKPSAALGGLLADYSIEILPKGARTSLEAMTCRLPARTRVYVAFTAGSLDQVVDAVQAVAEHGLTPVPHVPARRFESLAALGDFFKRLSARAPVRQVLLVGGDCAQPAGPLRESLDVLRSGILQDHGVQCVGFAGHPDGHPSVAAAVLRDSLRRKCDCAADAGFQVGVTTQFVFDIGGLFAWHAREIAPILPGVAVDVGMPGLVKMSTLLRFAGECGVAASIEMLRMHAWRAIGLATSFSPERALMQLAAGQSGRAAPAFRSIHFFPFGSFGRTVEWLESFRDAGRPSRLESIAEQVRID